MLRGTNTRPTARPRAPQQWRCRTGLTCTSCHSLRSPCLWPSSQDAQVSGLGRASRAGLPVHSPILGVSRPGPGDAQGPQLWQWGQEGLGTYGPSRCLPGWAVAEGVLLSLELGASCQQVWGQPSTCHLPTQEGAL